MFWYPGLSRFEQEEQIPRLFIVIFFGSKILLTETLLGKVKPTAMKNGDFFSSRYGYFISTLWSLRIIQIEGEILRFSVDWFYLSKNLHA